MAARACPWPCIDVCTATHLPRYVPILLMWCLAQTVLRCAVGSVRLLQRVPFVHLIGSSPAVHPSCSSMAVCTQRAVQCSGMAACTQCAAAVRCSVQRGLLAIPRSHRQRVWNHVRDATHACTCCCVTPRADHGQARCHHGIRHPGRGRPKRRHRPAITLGLLPPHLCDWPGSVHAVLVSTVLLCANAVIGGCVLAALFA